MSAHSIITLQTRTLDGMHPCHNLLAIGKIDLMRCINESEWKLEAWIFERHASRFCIVCVCVRAHLSIASTMEILSFELVAFIVTCNKFCVRGEWRQNTIRRISRAAAATHLHNFFTAIPYISDAITWIGDAHTHTHWCKWENYNEWIIRFFCVSSLRCPTPERTQSLCFLCKNWIPVMNWWIVVCSFCIVYKWYDNGSERSLSSFWSASVLSMLSSWLHVTNFEYLYQRFGTHTHTRALACKII